MIQHNTQLENVDNSKRYQHLGDYVLYKYETLFVFLRFCLFENNHHRDSQLRALVKEVKTGVLPQIPVITISPSRQR